LLQERYPEKREEMRRRKKSGKRKLKVAFAPVFNEDR
jgi:hypothetical protein